MTTALAGRRYTLADRMHIPWKRSLTAGINAHFRHRESLRPEAERILADPFAARLAEDHPALRLLAWLEPRVPAIRRTGEVQATAHCVRHAAIDALVREALADGFGDIVLVGAGYDMRASRFPVEGSRWFELDQPAVAARKEALLRDVPGVTPVRRAAVDLRRDDPLPALRAADWEPSSATCFVVEGLVHYFERERVHDLLTTLASGGPRRVVLSWIEPAMSHGVHAPFREAMRILGEIPRTFFARDELAALFSRAGLPRFRTWDFAAQVRDFAPVATGRPGGLTQEVGVASE
jgi:methyltransferase (TIGR00027 family)